MEKLIIGKHYVAYSETDVLPVKPKKQKPGKYWRIFSSQVVTLKRLQAQVGRLTGYKPDIEMLLNAIVETTFVGDEKLKTIVETIPEVRARDEAQIARIEAEAKNSAANSDTETAE